MSEALKPCPFCGDTPELSSIGDGWFYIGCDNTFCAMTVKVQCLSKTEPVRIWNRRAPAPASVAKGEESK